MPDSQDAQIEGFHYPTNSLSDESTFINQASNARLEVMESGQFETLVELNEDGPEESAKRFECEGTELELNEN